VLYLAEVGHDLLSKIHQDPKIRIHVDRQLRLGVLPVAHQIRDNPGVFVIVLGRRIVLRLFAFVYVMRINNDDFNAFSLQKFGQWKPVVSGRLDPQDDFSLGVLPLKLLHPRYKFR
jgi:hypothetical protein